MVVAVAFQQVFKYRFHHHCYCSTATIEPEGSHRTYSVTHSFICSDAATASLASDATLGDGASASFRVQGRTVGVITGAEAVMAI